jgi:hypothetical protein
VLKKENKHKLSTLVPQKFQSDSSDEEIHISKGGVINGSGPVPFSFGLVSAGDEGFLASGTVSVLGVVLILKRGTPGIARRRPTTLHTG